MSAEDRRDGVRFLTDLSVVLRPEKGGPPLDERAMAHDVSMKGFRLESQAQIEVDSVLSFTLDLQRGARASGKGRVVWSKRETFATWAGVEIIEMPWGDRRRLKQLIHPDDVDWTSFSQLCVKFIMAITVVAAAHRLATSPELRKFLWMMSPKILALFLLGWAISNLFKKERR